MSYLKNLKSLSIFALIGTILFLFWIFSEVQELKKSTEKGWFNPPVKFYSAPLRFKDGQKVSAQTLSNYLIKTGYRERGLKEPLGAKEFTFVPVEHCAAQLKLDLELNTTTCFFVLNKREENFVLQLSNSKILKIFKIKNNQPIEQIYFEAPPLLFAQMSQNKHVLRTHVKLSQIPRYCLDGVLAIEDDRFLNHRGVSIRGILRAAITNIRTGRFSQGGSTLTQQLVKNKFLTNKKTLSRKIKEAWLSVLLELVLTKEEILESYLNYIYWGQSGPYTINGIEEASKHYFGKSVSKIGLAECSLLAGAIKGPGIYGPHKERSKDRQEEVLNRMFSLNLISDQEVQKALNTDVNVVLSKSKQNVQAPYYVDAVKNEIKRINFSENLEGLSIYTEMDFFAQVEMEAAVDKHLRGRSKGFLGSVLIADNKLNSVIALTSGPSKSLNFNSALYGKRQVGSVAKPFVYLTALEENTSNLNPLTPISNKSFTYSYEGQKWTPKNYSSKDSADSYPMYIALSKSKNIPTVRLMNEFGYKKVYKNLLKYGFNKFSPVTPSLALGSFEASPLEVLAAYINLSLNSNETFEEKPSFIRKIKNVQKDILYRRDFESLDGSLMPTSKRMLLEMMKNTLIIGTAKRSQSLNLKGVYGGKTGTTNEHGDGWFAAVSPDYSYVTWVGNAPYLTERGAKLTGATAALPIWMEVIKRLEPIKRMSTEDWPVDEDELKELSFGDIEDLNKKNSKILIKR